MTGCELYGMGGGCDVNCPVLLAHECRLMDSDNKELYYEALYGHLGHVRYSTTAYELAKGSNINKIY